jgi:cytidylate kinase
VSDLIVAIDGPAGSGKSSVARALATSLGWSFLDTGAMYRAVTHEALRTGVDPHDEVAIGTLAGEITITTLPRVRVNDRDIEDEIRTDDVNHAVSIVAANPLVMASRIRSAWPLWRAYSSIM